MHHLKVRLKQEDNQATNTTERQKDNPISTLHGTVKSGLMYDLRGVSLRLNRKGKIGSPGKDSSQQTDFEQLDQDIEMAYEYGDVFAPQIKLNNPVSFLKHTRDTFKPKDVGIYDFE